MYAADKSRYQGQLTDQEHFMRKKDYRQKSGRLKELTRGLEKSVSQAEEEIKNLTESDETLYEQHKRLCTAEGTDDKTAAKMIVVTRGFTVFTDARRFCCHAERHLLLFVAKQGLAAGGQEYQNPPAPCGSGRRRKVQGWNCMSIMKGKRLRERNKMSVPNAVRAKLVHRMFAVIRNNQDYQKDYANAFA
ncbi:hypothetical protein Barb6XT_01274 [Bacteroidales bacterium Barb6XT]|nr:hypothetical protein Barb6XT_01274 [Bacteroidales bacterium Barb6XT]